MTAPRHLRASGRCLAIVLAMSACAPDTAAAQSPSCEYTPSVAPTAPGTSLTGVIFGSAASEPTFSVRTRVISGGDACAWNVGSDDQWLRFGHTASFMGDNEVRFEVFQNSGPPRTGTIKLSFPDGFSSSLPVLQAAPIACGQTVTGEFTPTDPVLNGYPRKPYDFAATAGDVIAVAVDDYDFGFGGSVGWGLYDPDGFNVRPSLIGGFGGPVFIRLPKSGTYTFVLVALGTVSQPVPYRATVFFVKGGSCSVPTVSCGGMMSGTLATQGDIGAYRVSATAGEVIAVSGTFNTVGRTSPEVKVFGPTGDELEAVPTGTSVPAFKVAVSGSQTIVLFTYNYQDAIRYNVGLHFLKGGSCAPTLSCGDIRSAAFDNAFEFDVYRFLAAAGERLFISRFNLAGMYVEVLDPDLKLVPSGENETWTAPAAGTYTVFARAGYASVTPTPQPLVGPYDISLQFQSSRCAYSMACGQLHTSTSTRKEIEAFTFSGVAGQTIATLTEVVLFGPSGTLVTKGTSYVPRYTLPSTGTYHGFVVRRQEGGDRRFAITCAGQCTAFLTATNKTFGPDGGVTHVEVVMGDGWNNEPACCFTSTSDAPWVRIPPENANACKSWPVGFSVDPFAGSGTRTATLTIAGQPLVVTQTGDLDAPRNLAAQVSGNRLTLSWTPGAVTSAAATYVVEAGNAPGVTGIRVSVGTATSFVAESAPNGVYYIRVRAVTTAGTSDPSNEVIAAVGNAGPPGTPTGLAASVNGTTVMLSWSAPSGTNSPTTYRVEVGTSAGSTNLGTLTTGSQQTNYVAGGIPYGTYVARVRAGNAAGYGYPSNEVTFTIGTGGCTSRPAAPSTLQSAISGRSVTLTWSAGAGGDAPTSYLIEAGSSPGMSNLARFSTGAIATVFAASAPPGSFFVRVRATNACGESDPSNEVIVTVTP